MEARISDHEPSPAETPPPVGATPPADAPLIPPPPPSGAQPPYTPPPAYPPPGYAAPGYPPDFGYYYAPRNDGMAITSLVLGITAFPAICCYGLPAVALGATALILGRMSLGKIRASAGTIGGEGYAQAGWITGVVAGSLGLLYMLFSIALFAVPFLALMFASTTSPSPTP